MEAFFLQFNQFYCFQAEGNQVRPKVTDKLIATFTRVVIEDSGKTRSKNSLSNPNRISYLTWSFKAVYF